MRHKATKARIVAAIGASGSGKTAWVRQQLQKGKPKRLIVWDAKPTSNYSDMGKLFTSIAELAYAVRDAGAKGELKAIFRPGTDLENFKDKFDLIGRLVFAWKNNTFVGEELATVTRPGWSPNGWLLCVTQGREEGLTLFGTAQRPALVDKTFIGNASLIHCGRLSGTNDRKIMANELDCSPDLLRDMKNLEWIERADTGETRRGVLTFGAT